MEPRELEIDEFNALNYFAEQEEVVNSETIYTIQTLKSTEFIDSFRIVVLPKKAIAYIKYISEASAEPEEITLIEKTKDNNQVLYKISEEGFRYVEYYKELILK